MHTTFLVAFALGCAAGCATAAPPASKSPLPELPELPAPPEAPSPVAAATTTAGEPEPTKIGDHNANDFTFALYAKAPRRSGNIAISGFVTRHAIGTVAAASPERDAVLRALHYAPSEQPGRAELDGWASAAEGLTFTSGARVFFERSTPLAQTFVDAARSRFGQTFAPVDFRTAPAAARHEIGAWISHTTGGQLGGDVPKELVPPGTAMMVGAAFGLEAQWHAPFDAAATAYAPFDHGKQRVRMMHQTTLAGFADVGDVQLLDLPLGENDSALSVLFVLPPAGTSLETLEARLDRRLYESWQSELGMGLVDIKVPRFHATTSFDVTPLLGALLGGVTLDASHVSRNGTTPRIRFFHEAVVTVDEGGVKAAAASLGSMAIAAPGEQKPIPKFVADRPFLYFIRDHASPGAPVLLVGRVENPKE